MSKVKLTNREIVNNLTSFRQVEQKQLPVKVSYTISYNANRIESVLMIFDKEKQKLIDKYVVKDGKGKIVLAPDNRSAKFKNDVAEAGWKEDFEALLSISNEIDIRKFKLSDIGGIQFSPAELTAINYMIEE